MNRKIILVILVLIAGMSKGQNKPPGKKSIAFEDIQPGGLLKNRAQLAYRHLQEEYFQWNSISRVNYEMFPGDAVGRCINGLTLLSRALHEPATSNLSEIMRRYDEIANSDGYLGPKLPDSRANEDVLAAHNGLLCGLTEYEIWTKDAKTEEKLKNVVEHLLVPAREAISYYRETSDAARKIDWVLSGGDIGQLFLVLDGMTRAYTIYPSAGLKATIETAIDRYRNLDLVRISAQTHAMLSATTGILRWYEIQHRPEDLAFAEALYKQYRDLAMTETYENYNWFNKPEWTEACAVTDSYILTVMLWRLTGKTSYLEDAHLILFNGLLAGQLSNGGFGTSACVGDAKGVYTTKEHNEAPFCCSMRGAEGLARAIQYSYFIENNSVTLPFYTANTATLRMQDGTCKVIETTEYPYKGKVKIEVLESQIKTKTNFQFFVPSWAIKNSLEIKVNGKRTKALMTNSFAAVTLQLAKGTIIELSFQQQYGARTSLHPAKSNGAVRYFSGPLLLGSETEKANKPFIPVLDLVTTVEKGKERFVYFPQNKSYPDTASSKKSGVSDKEKDCVVYRGDMPDEKVTQNMRKLFEDLKYDPKNVICAYLWTNPQEVSQIVLQWPESAVIPKPEDILLLLSDASNKLDVPHPGIIGNGRQWVYSLHKAGQLKAINNLVLILKSTNFDLSAIGIPDITVLRKH